MIQSWWENYISISCQRPCREPLYLLSAPGTCRGALAFSWSSACDVGISLPFHSSGTKWQGVTPGVSKSTFALVLKC